MVVLLFWILPQSSSGSCGMHRGQHGSRYRWVPVSACITHHFQSDWFCTVRTNHTEKEKKSDRKFGPITPRRTLDLWSIDWTRKSRPTLEPGEHHGFFNAHEDQQSSKQRQKPRGKTHTVMNRSDLPAGCVCRNEPGFIPIGYFIRRRNKLYRTLHDIRTYKLSRWRDIILLKSGLDCAKSINRNEVQQHYHFLKKRKPREVQIDGSESKRFICCHFSCIVFNCISNCNWFLCSYKKKMVYFLRTHIININQLSLNAVYDSKWFSLHSFVKIIHSC